MTTPAVHPLVKICGITRSADLELALDQGADYVGFNFYPPSPRSLSPAKAAALADQAEGLSQRVAILVDPSDDFLVSLLETVALDILQLHGSETPTRVEAVKKLTGRPVMKALKVGVREDFEQVPAHAEWADMILFDAKLPADPDALPGGNGLPFDWRLLDGLALDKPWALAGGLKPENLEAAYKFTRAPILDVSSGIEASPGLKDADRLCAFLKKAKALRQSRSGGVDRTATV